MSKSKIFISSTCYDLDQIRADLKNGLIEIGHDPILSEYKEFPVITGLDTISNCRRNVKENCDIFVLIIGGKRGSIDLDSNKPIINIEFETASDNSKEIFVFINKKVLSYYDIWKKNPDANFTPYVDDIKVFEFVAKIKNRQNWIFEFERAEEILDTLKIQLSVLLNYLIQRKKTGTLDPMGEFLLENNTIQKYAIEKPPFWEYLLTIELMRDRVNRVKSKFEEMQMGLVFYKTFRLDVKEFFDKMGMKMDDLKQMLILLTKVTEEEFLVAWGRPGEPGDPFKIKKAVDRFYLIGLEIFQWEMEIRSIIVDDDLISLKEALYGTAKAIFDDASKLIDLMEEPISAGKTGSIHIVFTINPPDNIAIFNQKVKDLKLKYGIWN